MQSCSVDQPQSTSILLVRGALYTYLTGMDNKYKDGTLIVAKSDPNRQLIIDRYLDRIYYCKVVSEPQGKLLAYYERELTPPAIAPD
jgi:hypothetical protein